MDFYGTTRDEIPVYIQSEIQHFSLLPKSYFLCSECEQDLDHQKRKYNQMIDEHLKYEYTSRCYCNSCRSLEGCIPFSLFWERPRCEDEQCSNRIHQELQTRSNNRFVVGGTYTLTDMMVNIKYKCNNSDNAYIIYCATNYDNEEVLASIHKAVKKNDRWTVYPGAVIRSKWLGIYDEKYTLRDRLGIV